MRSTMLLQAAFLVSLAALTACDELGNGKADELLSPADAGARKVAGNSPKKLDPALCALDRGGFSLASTNPYFPLGVGSQWVLEGEEDDTFLEVQITVLDETEVVGGVTTRVVEEREWEDGELLEVSRNFFAVAPDGTVCYFGEDVDIFEDGEVSHEGAWRADEPGFRPGIAMPADPQPGMKFQMEGAPGIAEDEAKIVGIGPVTVPAGTFTDTIRFQELNPLDGDRGTKVFAAGVGLVVDGPIDLVSFDL